MASFAKAQLLKYGWTEGKGLGKYENGIVDPLKPKLKFDNAGVGHDSKEFKWWESVYDKASNNVRVSPTEGNCEISVTARDNEALDISTSRINVKKLAKKHNLRYGNFLKTSTLESGKVVREKNLEKIEINDIVSETASIALTDEQLFRACGGRTAHKGARHGLKLGGKLARIAQQEAQLLGNMEKKLINSEDWTVIKKKKKKSRRSVASIDTKIFNDTKNIDDNANNVKESLSSTMKTTKTTITTIVDSASTSHVEKPKKSKNTRRKEKRRFQALTSKLNAFSLIDEKNNDDDDVDVEKRIEKKYSTKKRKRDDKSSNEANRKILDNSIIIFDNEDNDDNDIVDKIRELPAKRKKYSQKMYESRKKRKSVGTDFRPSIDPKKSVERLSDCLMAVNLSEDSVDSGRGEDLIFNCEITRKMKNFKKGKKIKRERKIEENFNHDYQI